MDGPTGWLLLLGIGAVLLVVRELRLRRESQWDDVPESPDDRRRPGADALPAFDPADLLAPCSVLTRASALLILIVFCPLSVSAQETGERDQGRGDARRPRVSAGQLLGGRPAAAAFQELEGLLSRGHEIVVWQESGRRSRGRVVSISDAEVVIIRRSPSPLLRWLFPARERVVPAASVQRVDIVDSTVNGALLGAAVGAGVYLGLVAANHEALEESSLKPVGYVSLALVSFVPSIALGQFIDLRVNESIYRGVGPTSRVTLARPAGRGRALGIRVRVRF